MTRSLAYPVPLPRLRPILAAVGLLVAGALALAFGSVLFTGRSAQLHLVFNLMLALVPLGLALGIAWTDSRGRSGWAIALGIPWLLFLPNSPYLLTDFIHLRQAPTVWAWGYLLLLVWHSFAGLVAGLLSLRLVHHHIDVRGRAGLGWAVVSCAAALSGFGMALGRFDRWHSWHVLFHPREILNDAFRRASFWNSPVETAVVAGLGLFVFVSYVLFRVLTPSTNHFEYEPGRTAALGWHPPGTETNPQLTTPTATAKETGLGTSASADPTRSCAGIVRPSGPARDHRAFTS